MTGDARDHRSEEYERRLQELEEWMSSNGGVVPKQSAPKLSAEKRLAMWLSGLQGRFMHGKLQEEQLLMLRKIPGMEERVVQWELRRLDDKVAGSSPALATPPATATNGAADGEAVAEGPTAAKSPPPGAEGEEAPLAAEPPAAANAEEAADYEALLPPDAPPESAAHKKVSFRDAPMVPNPFAVITYMGKDKSRTQVQATVHLAGSRYNAERIVRACYHMLEEGCSKEEVLDFRAACYERLREVHGNRPGCRPGTKPGGKLTRTNSKDDETNVAAALGQAKEAAAKSSPPQAPKPAAGHGVANGDGNAEDAAAPPAAPASPANDGAAKDGSAKDGAANDGAEDGAKGGAIGLPGPLEDAPEGHAAWTGVRYEACNKCAKFRFVLPSKEKVSFQTTIKASGGSMEEACRLARLCYVRFVQGSSKEEVLRYRDQLYGMVKGGVAPQSLAVQPRDVGAPEEAAAPKEERPKKKRQSGKRKKKSELVEVEDAKKRKMSTEGKNQPREEKDTDNAKGDRPPAGPPPAGSIRLEGRAESKTNASINGIYTPLAGGFEGGLAYEKCPEPGARRRLFLFFAPPRKRWKVSDKLGDLKGGFAYVKAIDGTKPPSDLPEDVRWSVWDGKDAGYNKDKDIRCSLIGGDGLPSQPSQPGGKSQEAEADAASAASSGSSSSSGSDAEDEGGDSDSGESASSAASAASAKNFGEDAAADGGSEAPAAVPKAAPEAAKEASATRLSAFGPPPKRGRICAKMLVRSGLRCVCHFDYAMRCPNAARHGG